MEDKGSFRASRPIPSEREDGAEASVPMLEKMARAMNDRAGRTEYGPVIPASLLEPIARAALEAIREIGPETMWAVQWGRVPDRIQSYWSDVINAILQGKA